MWEAVITGLDAEEEEDDKISRASVAFLLESLYVFISSWRAASSMPLNGELQVP